MAKDPAIFQPHDALFKSTMQNVSMAKELVREYFPKDQLKVMDLDTMRLESSDFLHDNLRRSQADVLYSLETTQGLGYIYTLVEHQSSPDPQMPLRILEYQVGVMRKILNVHFWRVFRITPFREQ